MTLGIEPKIGREEPVGSDSAIEALLHASGFTHPVAQIKELRPPHLTAPLNLHGSNLGGMEKKDSLHADALEDATNGDGFVDAAMALGDDNTLIRLNPFFIAFPDTYPHANGITHIDICLLYTSPSPRDQRGSRMPSSA